MLSTEVRARRIKYLILILLVISLGLRVWGLDTQSIWRDEADSLRFASSPAQLQEMFLTPGHNAPLYYLALRGWTRDSRDGSSLRGRRPRRSTSCTGRPRSASASPGAPGLMRLPSSLSGQSSLFTD